MSKRTPDRLLKFILVGESRVGKTSLRLKYMGINFNANYIPTLGADISINKYQNYNLQIWDLAGQVDFIHISKNYCKGGHGVIFVFDVTRPETLQTLSEWLDLFIEVNQKMVPSIIIGNKIDLRNSLDEAKYRKHVMKYIVEVTDKYCMKFHYIETSALTGENVSSVFENLIYDISNLIK